MRLVRAFVNYKGFEQTKHFGAIDWAEYFLSNDGIFSLQTNFCARLEQFWFHFWRDYPVYGTAGLTINARFFNILYFLTRVAMKPKVFAGTYLPSISIFRNACVELAYLQLVVVGQEIVFFWIILVEQHIGISEYFSCWFSIWGRYRTSS